MFIHKTSGVSLTALIDTFVRFSWYDMIWHLLQLTWEIRLCDQKGILLCCRGTGEHSVIRPLWWTNSKIGLKNKFQHIQTPSKHSMNIFYDISQFTLLDRKLLGRSWCFLYPICDFKYIFCNHLTFLFKSTEISLKQKALFPLCSLRTIPCRCNGVASNLFYRQMHITCIIIM